MVKTGETNFVKNNEGRRYNNVFEMCEIFQSYRRDEKPSSLLGV